MRAIINCTGFSEKLKPLNDYRPTPLMNVVGKPVLFYVLDELVRRGINHVSLILCHLPRMIEEKVQEGKRWGLTIDYYLVQNPEKPFSIIGTSSYQWEQDKILLGRGDEIPKLDDLEEKSSLFFYPHNGWSGWGIIEVTDIKNLQFVPYNEIPTVLNLPQKKAQPFIRIHDFNELLETNLRLIAIHSKDHLFPSSARMVEPDVWISRGVIMHPSVTIKGQAFIGENVHLEEKAVIGPGAVIENDCFIDKGSIITNSVVSQNSYVGEKLEIERCYIDRNLLVDLRNETKIHLTDTFILSELNQSYNDSFLYTLFERGLAFILMLLFYPLEFFFSANSEIGEVVILPVKDNHYRTFLWRQYKGKGMAHFFRHYPLLKEIVKGKVHFIGSTPRSIKEIEAMPSDWRTLYLTSRLGLITLADLDKGDNEDERYASDAYYAVHRNFLFDVRCFFRWLKQKFAI